MKELDQSIYDACDQEIQEVDSQSIDFNLLKSKIEFSDFLKVMERESGFREIIDEKQIYFRSTKRLIERPLLKLITKTALDALQNMAKVNGQVGKIPQATYQIERILMFKFKQNQYLICAFENKTVQLYDYQTGRYLSEFQFLDNVLSMLLNAHDAENDGKKKKSGLACQVPQLVELQDKNTQNLNQMVRSTEDSINGPLNTEAKDDAGVDNDELDDRFGETFFTKDDKIESWNQNEEDNVFSNFQKTKTMGFNQSQLLGYNLKNTRNKNKLSMTMANNAINQELEQKNSRNIRKSLTFKNERGLDQTRKTVTQSLRSRSSFPTSPQSQLIVKKNTRMSYDDIRSVVETYHQKNSKVSNHLKHRRLKSESQQKIASFGGYEILGIDDITEPEDPEFIKKQKMAASESNKDNKSESNKTFMMPYSIFMQLPERKQVASDFKSMIKKIDDQMKRNRKILGKYEESSQDVVSSPQHRRGTMSLLGTGGSHKTSAQTSPRTKKFEDLNVHDIKYVEDKLYNLRAKKSVVWQKLRDLKEKNSVLGEWLEDFDQLQNKPILGLTNTIKNVFNARKQIEENQTNIEDRIEVGKENQIANNSTESTINLLNLGVQKVVEQANYYNTNSYVTKSKNYRDKMNKERIKRLQNYQKEQQQEQQAQNSLKKVEIKKTYPISIEYCDEFNLCLFALISGEIQVHMLKSVGLKIKFIMIQQMRVDKIIQCMIVKVAEKHLNVIVGTQGETQSKDNDGESISEVAIFKLDPKNDFKVYQSYRFVLNMTVSNMYFHVNCGLICCSYLGRIEIIDAMEPQNCNSVWRNYQTNEEQQLELQLKNLKEQSQSRIFSQSNFMDTQKSQGKIGQDKARELIQKLNYQQKIKLEEKYEKLLFKKEPIEKKQIATNLGPKDLCTISAIAYSIQLDVIALGSVTGIINFMNQSTKLHQGEIAAHTSEIATLKFYDDQYQLISITMNGEVGLWNAQKRSRLQTIKFGPSLQQSHLSSCFVFISNSLKEKKNESIVEALVCTSKIFRCQLVIDEKVKIHADQQAAIARDHLRQILQRYEQEGLLQQKKHETLDKFMIDPKQYLNELYEEAKGLDQKEIQGTVLASKNSPLIGMIFDEINYELYCIDRDLMIRVWNLNNGLCRRSYMIETREAKMKSIHDDNNESPSTQNKRAQFVMADKTLRYLIISYEGREISVNYLFTGALIYNNINVNPIKLQNECSNFIFIPTSNAYWFAASCYDGKVNFLSKPKSSQGQTYLEARCLDHSHKQEVVSLDINSLNQLVTACIGNTLKFWNIFEARLSKQIKHIQGFIKPEDDDRIQYIKFPFPFKSDVLLVIINTGGCFILDTQKEELIRSKVHGNYNVAQISPNALADYQFDHVNKYGILVSINNDCQLCINKLKYEAPFTVFENVKNQRVQRSRQSQVQFVGIKISIDLNLLITSEKNGVVNLYSLETGSFKFQINSTEQKLNQEIQNKSQVFQKTIQDMKQMKYNQQNIKGSKADSEIQKEKTLIEKLLEEEEAEKQQKLAKKQRKEEKHQKYLKRIKKIDWKYLNNWIQKAKDSVFERKKREQYEDLSASIEAEEKESQAVIRKNRPSIQRYQSFFIDGEQAHRESKLYFKTNQL